MAEMQQKSAAEMSRSELAAQAAGAVVVEIYGQVYQLRGTDTAHIEKLAGIVDGKMRAVSAHGATVDSLRVAVLAALNIADELTAASAAQAEVDSLQKEREAVKLRVEKMLAQMDELL